MRIGVTGATGLLGIGLSRVLLKRHRRFLLTRSDADLTKANQVMSALRSLRLDVLIHTAAMADVDACQRYPEKAFRVNFGGTANLVSAAEKFGFSLVFISSDAVFDGLKGTPYVESDAPHPLSIYGETKVAAEKDVRTRLQQHWIFRLSVLFGPGKINFVDKCIRALADGKTNVAASDQIGSATYTLDAADKILEVIEAERYGTYHLSNQGTCGRLELARYAASLTGLDQRKIIGKTVAQMGRVAPRPLYNEMKMQALEKAGFSLPRKWKDALAAHLETKG